MVLFLGRVEDYAKRLDGSELEISAYRRILKVQKAAPKDWKSFFDGMRANDKVIKDWQAFRTKVLAEEVQRTAIYEKEDDIERGTFNTERKGGVVKCFKCHKAGHKAFQCHEGSKFSGDRTAAEGHSGVKCF